jgi:hypothetical protein
MENKLGQRFVLHTNGKQTGPAIRVERRVVLNVNGKQTGPAIRVERQWKTNWASDSC